MIEFTVELEEKTLTVMADRVKEEFGALKFYITTKKLLKGVGGYYEVEEVVGKFTDYKCFYIKGD